MSRSPKTPRQLPLRTNRLTALRIEFRPSTHFDQRPPGVKVDTIVLHCMYAADSRSPYRVEDCLRVLDTCKVSAHYLVSRRGRIIKLVDESSRAWHAGISKLPLPRDQRENVNHFSIGIELIGKPNLAATKSQLAALEALLTRICAQHPIRLLIGHDAIAPERKTDPGKALNWSQLARQLTPKFKKRGIKPPLIWDSGRNSPV